MTKQPTSQPPRLMPDQPLPPYAYLLGRTPHPIRDPEGHSYGADFEMPDRPDPVNWSACRDYLYGIDLFNHGFYWEAHEAWESLWVACGRRGVSATFLQALINLAAAGFKARSGNARGLRANAETARRLFEALARQFEPDGGRYMGLDLRALAGYAGAISKSRQTSKTGLGKENLPTLDLVLLPK